MMRGVKPFVGIKNDEVISKIELGERLPLPADTPAPLFSLMNRCWSYEPEKRPYFRDIEATVADVLEEERQLESLTSRRAPPTAPPTDYAPEKPPYRPHSSQGFMQVKRSSLLSDEETWQHNRMSGNLDDSPALPPRIATRFREISPSPHPRDHTPSPHTNGSETPPPKPPRRISPEIPPEPVLQLRANPPPIVPYSVTTITHGDSPAPQMTSDLRRSESPCHPVAIAPIPPPSILLRGNEGAPTESTPSGGVYYSIPEDGVRSLREDGQFVSSRGSGHGSITGSESSREGEVGVSGEMEEKGEVGEAVGEEEVLGKVTNVVKAVMELSHRVSLSPPDEYLELVKGVGMAMRELLHTVDGIRRKIPVQSHHEVRIIKCSIDRLTALQQTWNNGNSITLIVKLFCVCAVGTIQTIILYCQLF
ncbi:Focal adhesion kinase 1 [Geodia barretti]|nr:Focal adhesion kinase 1 [Geodia barretti]